MTPAGGEQARPHTLVLVAIAAVAAAVTVVALMLLDGGDPPGPVAGNPAAVSTTQEPTTATVTVVAKRPPPPPKKPAASPAKMIGQKIMVGFRQQATPPQSLLDDISAGRVGGVILFSENNGAGRGYASVARQLRRAGEKGNQPTLLIAIDQEGGMVKRISQGPPSMSPNEMGRQGSGVARAQGLATGRDLRGRGINVNLAPVVDVPSSADSFLGDRTFGTTPDGVSATAAAFASGMQEARVAATAKHYPGLGTTGQANTDVAPVTVDTPGDELTRRAKPFHALVRQDVQLVMMSSATYTALDPKKPAVLSRIVVYKRLRSFFRKGVVISDDLGTPSLAAHGSDVPVLASNAGVDILLYVDSKARGAYSAMVKALESGKLRRSRLEASYQRIMALKAWVAGG